MASTLDTRAADEREDLSGEPVVARVDAAELKAARDDRRVRSFLEEADAYVAEFEQQGRNR